MPTSGSSAHRHARPSSSSPSATASAASPAASPSRSRSPTNGRTIAPSLIHDPSTLQTLSSTLSVLSKHASSGLHSLSSAAALASGRAKAQTSAAQEPSPARSQQPYPSTSPSPTDLLGTSPSPIFNAMGGGPDVAGESAGGISAQHDDLLDSQLSGLEDILASSERITYATWDHMPLTADPDTPAAPAEPALSLVLIIAYASGGLQIFAKQSSQFREVLNFQQVLLPGDQVAGRVLAAKVQRIQPEGRPHLLLVTEGHETGTLVLARCSVDSQMVDDTAVISCPPSGTGVDAQRQPHQQHYPYRHHSHHAPQPSAATPSVTLQLSDRHLVVARSHPPAIHILDPLTFEAVQDDITDVASSSSSTARPPPCHLSGRLLVYASTDSEVDPNVITSAAATAAAAGRARREGGRASTGSFGPAGGAGPAASGAGVAVDVFNAESVRLSAIEAGAHASDMAKRVGGGLMTGVRNLGDWGASYLSGHGSGGASGARDAQAAKVSKSAPNASPALFSVTSPTLSPALLPGGVESRQKRTTSVGSPHAEQQQQQPRPATAAVIRVLDLKRGGKLSDQVVASFTSGVQSVACVKADPSGSLVFVADTLGHAFHVFEIRPRPSCLNVRAAASTSTASPSSSSLPPTLHRFKLLRGITSAHVCDAKWSVDGRWVAVLTQNGTVHVYSLGATHGPRALPLSSALRSFARTPRPRARAEPHQALGDAAYTHANSVGGPAAAADTAPVAPAFTFGPAELDAATPGGTPLSSSPAAASHAAGIDVLCLHPSIAAVTMSRVVTASASLSETVASSAADATHRVSGLTAMMRRASVGPPAPRAAPRTRSNTAAPRRAIGEGVAVAIWSDLARQYDAPEVRPRQPHRRDSQSNAAAAAAAAITRSTRWVSFAEVETYDRTPRALPTPLYLSHQFRFCIFVQPAGPGADADAVMRLEPTLIDVPRCRIRRLHTRESVRVQRGHAEEGGDDAAAADAAAASSSFDTSLASAIAAVHFDPHSPSPEAEAFRARSPSSCIPSFPQGHSARRPSWRTSVTSGMSIPIRMGAAASRGVVAGVAVGGTRARAGSSFGRSGRGSAGAGAGPGLSFDEDASHDAYIFADARNAAPSPNGCAPGSLPSRVTSTSSSASPGGRSGSGSGPGSADTAPTTLSDDEEGSGDADADEDGGYSDADEDDDLDEEDSWAAARGLQEDVEGDALGWDSFADPEFGGGGAKPAPHQRSRAAAAAGTTGSKKARAARAQAARMHNAHDRREREDFLVGGLALDEEAGAGAGVGGGQAAGSKLTAGPGSSASSGDSTATSTAGNTKTTAAASTETATAGAKLPPFSRKVHTNSNVNVLPHSASVNADSNAANLEAEGEGSGPEGSKHTSTTTPPPGAQQQKVPAVGSGAGAGQMGKVKRKVKKM